MNDVYPGSSRPHLRYGPDGWSSREGLANKWAGRLIVAGRDSDAARTFISELDRIYREFLDSNRVVRKGNLTGGASFFAPLRKRS